MSCGGFAKGERVVCGSRAVCRVNDVGPLPFGAPSRDYYTLRPIFERGCETIYAPVGCGVSMRRVMSREEAERCLESAGSVSPAEDGGEPYRTEALREQDAGMLLRCLKGCEAATRRPRAPPCSRATGSLWTGPRSSSTASWPRRLTGRPTEIKSEVEAAFFRAEPPGYDRKRMKQPRIRQDAGHFCLISFKIRPHAPRRAAIRAAAGCG